MHTKLTDSPAQHFRQIFKNEEKNVILLCCNLLDYIHIHTRYLNPDKHADFFYTSNVRQKLKIRKTYNYFTDETTKDSIIQTEIIFLACLLNSDYNYTCRSFPSYIEALIVSH